MTKPIFENYCSQPNVWRNFNSVNSNDRANLLFCFPVCSGPDIKEVENNEKRKQSSWAKSPTNSSYNVGSVPTRIPQKKRIVGNRDRSGKAKTGIQMVSRKWQEGRICH